MESRLDGWASRNNWIGRLRNMELWTCLAPHCDRRRIGSFLKILGMDICRMLPILPEIVDHFARRVDAPLEMSLMLLRDGHGERRFCDLRDIDPEGFSL